LYACASLFIASMMATTVFLACADRCRHLPDRFDHPRPTVSNPCVGKVFTVDMHHQRDEQAKPGDNVGLDIKGLDHQNQSLEERPCSSTSWRSFG